MQQKNFDYCIVGQGIAGTLLAYFLKKSGKSVLIFDKNLEGAASMVAAGIVNPVTGKNFVKTWRAEEFLGAAIEIYDDIAQELGILTYTPANILRAILSTEEENIWLSRSSDTQFDQYILDPFDASEYVGKVVKPFTYGESKGSFHVHLKTILLAFRKKWLADSSLVNEEFIHQDLHILEKSFTYHNYTFNDLIYCEGHRAIDNPFFNDIGLDPAKGEVLLIRIPDVAFRKMYKDKIFIVHQHDDLYWVGSGYEWNATDDQPTQKAYQFLVSEIDRILTVPYEIIGHQAAIRPTMRDRRPVFMRHWEHQNMYIFNGLGTKGSSIAPYAARQFARYLLYRDDADMML